MYRLQVINLSDSKTKKVATAYSVASYISNLKVIKARLLNMLENQIMVTYGGTFMKYIC